MSEVSGRVEHGPVASPNCVGDGVVARLAHRGLGWVVPSQWIVDQPSGIAVGCSGFIDAEDVVAWSSGGGELVVAYRRSAITGDEASLALRIRADEAELAAFLRRAARVLPTSKRVDDAARHPPTKHG
jgi:hypothetical protein